MSCPLLVPREEQCSLCALPGATVPKDRIAVPPVVEPDSKSTPQFGWVVSVTVDGTEGSYWYPLLPTFSQVREDHGSLHATARFLIRRANRGDYTAAHEPKDRS